MNLRGVVNIPGATLTAGTTYNVACGVAPADQRIAITGFGFFGTYNAAATAGLLQFCDAGTQGSGGTTLTIKHVIKDQTTPFQSSWIGMPSTAPSTIVPNDTRYVNAQLGLTELWGPDDWIEIGGGGFFIVQFTPQQTATYGGWLRINE